MFNRKTILNHEMNQKKSLTLIRNLLEEFRNHLRIARALIIKKRLMKHLSHCKARRRTRTRLIKNQRKSRIEKSKIVLVCVTKNICSKTVIIWSRKFVRLNENRTKKLKEKSSKFSKRIRDFKSQLDWSQSWVSNMSNSSTRFNSRIEQKCLFDESNRILAIVRRSNPIREIVRNLRLDKIR
jgi:hypothetical protein